MAHSFLVTKEKLKAAIQNVCRRTSEFVKNPEKDFIKKRKISFADVFHFLLSLEAKSIEKEMLRFWSYSSDTPTESALIQARRKIKISAFEELFHRFTHVLQTGATFYGYQLFATDGSEFSYPENKKEPLCWTKNPKTEKGRNVLHLNALYHLERGIFEDVLFQELHEVNEHTALAEMMKRSSISGEFIIIADRGYESYNSMAHIEQAGGHFVIRGKAESGGIQSGMILPDTEEFDEEVSIIICKKHTKQTKENPEKYKRIRSDAKFDFFSEDCTEYPMTFRIVKVKISEDLTELLFTNLPKEEFSVELLKELYHKRWGIETAFSQLKYALGAVALHSRKAEFVKQELYTKVILFNFCKSILGRVKVKKVPNGKHEYQINVTMAMDICKNFWCSSKETAPSEIEKLLLKYLVPVRKNRHFPRDSVSRSVIAFNVRIA